MQNTERIHPGGKPAPSQPSNEIPLSGSVIFRRLVLKSREQSEPENDIGTKETIEASEKDKTEDVPGKLYAWASNICHVEDDKVQVEDISDRDIDPQLAQDTQVLLSEALKCNAETKSEYSRSEQPGGLVREEFTIRRGLSGAWRVCRIIYTHIDVHSGKTSQYSESKIARRIYEAAKANAALPPSEDQVKHVARRIVARNGGELPKVPVKQKGKTLVQQAQEELFIHRNDAAFKLELEREMQATERPADQTPEILSLVEEIWPKRMPSNPFHQYVLDTEATNVCERVEGYDVVILEDKNGELICGVVTNALQKLLPDGTVDKMSTAVEAFAWRFPYKKADEIRHPASKIVHLARFPDKDVRSPECKQPHFAVCGVEHYGVHHEVGHNDFKSLHFQRFSPKGENCSSLFEKSAWKVEFPKLKGGVFGIATKVSRLSLKSWDPKLYDEYLETNEWLPDPLKAMLAKTGDNPYGYMAHLVDPLTEGHTDSKDWTKGMAALTCSGEFDGGDLVLPELGVRIPFPSGSNCHLRGKELYHLITGYEGIRHSVVLTNKDSVRLIARKFKARFEEEMDKVAKLQSKDQKDWSDDEVQLHEASMKGKSAVLELIWSSEKEKEKAMEEQRKAEKKKRKAEEEKGKADDAQVDNQEHLPKKPKKTDTLTSQ